jgi:hypothetical protein
LPVKIKEINRIQLNKINRLKTDAIKKFVHTSVRIKGSKSCVLISCLLEGEDLVESEDLKDMSVTSMQGWYHVMWTYLFSIQISLP